MSKSNNIKADNDYIVEVKNLKKWFKKGKGIKSLLGGDVNYVKAIDGVSFSIKRGEVFGLIGESGCGKSTTARVVMKLHEPTEGDLIFNGENVTNVNKERLRLYREEVQMIFQDPYASMNPRFKIKDVLEEALLIHNIEPDREKRMERMRDALTEVKLTPPDDFLSRYPHLLSGGQRQRAATARALMLQPQVLVADEPVSMIDLSTKAEILQMFKEIQKDMGLTYLYITHDLSTARYFTDRIAVMYLGRIVEMGTPEDVIDNPKHPYTKALIEAVCDLGPGKVGKVKEVPIKGEIPSASNIPQGCRFHPRCLYATDDCRKLPEPELEVVENKDGSAREGHTAACRRYKELH
jgi:peptide/nickel transport system ATP-binding protein